MAMKVFYVLGLSGFALAEIPYCGAGDKKVKRQAAATTTYDPDADLLSVYSLEAIDYASWIPSLEAVTATAIGDALTLASEELAYYKSDYACILSVLSNEILTSIAVVTTIPTLTTSTTTAAITYPTISAPTVTATYTTTSTPTTTATYTSISRTTSTTNHVPTSLTTSVPASIPTSITAAATTPTTAFTSASSTTPAALSSSTSPNTNNGVTSVGTPSTFAFQVEGAVLAYLLSTLFL